MKTKTIKLVLDGFGQYLGSEKGLFFVHNEKTDTIRKIPLSENEISEIQIKSGNSVSCGALVLCGFWNIPVTFFTGYGRPMAMLKNLDDDSHVETRISQYEALNNSKGLEIAKQIVLAKLEGQNQVLRKYGLRSLDVFRYQQQIKAIEGDLKTVRARLMNIEGHFSQRYFSEIFQVFIEKIRPESRKTFKAYNGVNNLFNLAYEVLSWKVQRALWKAKLEPFLGYLHSLKRGRPSLICDFQELYRHLTDDYVLTFGRKLHKSDFTVKIQEYADKRAVRMFLNDEKTTLFMKGLDGVFESEIEIPRIRRGKQQQLETLINEEALLFAEYLRNEKQSWKPRIANLNEGLVKNPFPLIAQG